LLRICATALPSTRVCEGEAKAAASRPQSKTRREF
jgi:hypothetical protein